MNGSIIAPRKQMKLMKEPDIKDTEAYCAWLDEEMREVKQSELDNLKGLIKCYDSVIDDKSKPMKKKKKFVKQKCEAVYCLALLEQKKERNEKIGLIMSKLSWNV